MYNANENTNPNFMVNLYFFRCVKDLREKYAMCEIMVSDPVVGFNETVVLSDTKTGEKTVADSVTITTASKVNN